MPTHGGKCVKKTGRRYDRDFKISILAELEAGKPLAHIARKYGVHPSLPSRWKAELAENPERAFSGNGNICKYEARIAELERLLGQAHAENDVLHSPEESPGGETKTYTKRRYITSLIHHSNQGVQYASKDYVDCLKTFAF